MEPVELRLPVPLSEDTVPVGPEGIWSWLAAVGRGEAGVLKFSPGTSFSELATFFYMAARASELAVGARAALTAKDMALIVRNGLASEPEPEGWNSCF